MFADTFLILFISVATAFLGEGLTWLLVYRTEKYQKLKSEVEKQSKKLEKQKETIGGETSDRSQKKKLERQEERLKSNNRDLSLRQLLAAKTGSSSGGCHMAMLAENITTCAVTAGLDTILKVKMKSMFAIGFAFTALLSMFNSIFDGRMVAKLPFIPISLLQNLSHRNLIGEDYTDCSFIFLYILCTMSIRQNIQKMLGFAPSRAANKQGGGLFSTPGQVSK